MINVNNHLNLLVRSSLLTTIIINNRDRTRFGPKGGGTLGVCIYIFLHIVKKIIIVYSLVFI